MALIQKAFSDIITFSRSSNATRVGPNGLVQYAPHNLLVRSEEFDNAAWTKSNTTVTANAAAAPNGTVTADLLTENTSNASHQIYVTPSIDLSITNTFSVYVKPNGRTKFLLLLMKNAGAYDNVQADFDTAALTATTTTAGGGVAVSASITSVGSGWFRCTVSGSTTFNGSNFVLLGLKNGAGASSYTGDGTSGIYLWGAQLSVGPYALDYTPTTSAAVYGPRFDYDGSGVTIVEPVSRNLLLYSEQFNNAYWTKAQTSVTANSVTSPDGTVTADKLVEDSTTDTHLTFVSFSASAQVYTFSAYLKAGERTWGILRLDTGNNQLVSFNLSTGTVGTVASGYTASISPAGNGWYRCTVTRTLTAANYYAVISVASADNTEIYAGNGISGIYIWGAQLELGSTATGYMVSGATNGFRAVPVVSGSATARGLLVEEQRTNLALYSDDFSNAAWSKTRSSITANAIAAPDGTITADKLVEDTTASNTHFIVQGIAMGGSVDSSRFAFGIFAKAGERSRIRMFDNNQSSSGDTTFNLSTGTVVTGTGTITNVGNGWYRCTIYPLKDFSTTSTVRIELDNGSTTSYTGDGTSGIYLWGAQLEVGSFATSYIPTLASTVTRSADVASVNTLSPWYSSTGTIYTEIERYASSQNVRGSIFHDGTTSNYIGSSEYTFGGQGGVVVAGGVGQAGLGAGGSALGVRKLAFAFGTNDFALSENGGTVTTDTSGTVPTVTALGIGSLTSANVGTGYIRRIAFYPRRLTNAELQALSA